MPPTAADDKRAEKAPLLASTRGTGYLNPRHRPDAQSSSCFDDAGAGQRADDAEAGPRRRGPSHRPAIVAEHAAVPADDEDSTFASFPQIHPQVIPEKSKFKRRGWRGRLRGAIARTWRMCAMAAAGGDSVGVSMGPVEGGAAAAASTIVDFDSDGKEYYIDPYNDQPWRCTFGTSEGDGIWMNTSDQPGTIMSFSVWVLIGYAAFTVTLVSEQGRIPAPVAMAYCTVCALALASHAKTTFTDPGSVPQCAVPLESESRRVTYHAMCSQCQAFKPHNCHHCRICDRCISRMDHHCPWMNNCIGAANLKHFILFLLYAWTASALALLIFAWNFVLCRFPSHNDDFTCTFSPVLRQLLRIMTLIAIASLLFVTSMIVNVLFGLMTGMGTIDRMKRHSGTAVDDNHSYDPGTVPPEEVFGIGGYHTWILPVDPIFRDHDGVLGYSTPQRLLREMALLSDNSSGGSSPSIAGESVGSKDWAPV